MGQKTWDTPLWRLQFRTRVADLLTGNVPRPTPQPTRVRWITVFGPLAGHIHHEPDDGQYEYVSAHVTLRDAAVGAWFQNPYAHTYTQPFAYGLRLRSSPDASSLVFVVHSRGDWQVRKRIGNQRSVVIAEGAAPTLRTSASQWNHISVLAVGDFGALFLNGQWMPSTNGANVFPLGTDTKAGGIAIIDGYFRGTEREGAITRFESFAGQVPIASSVSDTPAIHDLMAQAEAEYRAGPPSDDAAQEQPPE